MHKDTEMHIYLVSYNEMKKTRLPILCLFCVNGQAANSSQKKILKKKHTFVTKIFEFGMLCDSL